MRATNPVNRVKNIEKREDTSRRNKERGNKNKNSLKFLQIILYFIKNQIKKLKVKLKNIKKYLSI